MGIQTPNEIWQGAAGLADSTSNIPMTADMKMRLASITKPLTAFLTMKLVEDGVLQLNDTVEDYLPGQLPEVDEITVKMLLNHSGGITDVITNIDFGEEVYNDPFKDWEHQEIISLLS